MNSLPMLFLNPPSTMTKIEENVVIINIDVHYYENLYHGIEVFLYCHAILQLQNINVIIQSQTLMIIHIRLISHLFLDLLHFIC